ncbi:uncharacterized protein BDZ99DRAFT_519201 [Mytilinidion resinicola]|uniref:F-box domain-containing protein n=1 Tax=Mytilinidion resinicola TaxID=574789 RepID=A0A6A6YT63_9PEZI|nr:uncharacterized protein BDZ99DRAFT_519201 [Mytilinidion resinicola]KAF2811961.1 hypothetical protein BDZ99DRAFT_519201 [Mytilinidion resinicola]
MSAPFDRLPADLVPQIFQYVPEQDRHSLTLVCKSLQAEATKLLYCDVSFQLHSYMGSPITFRLLALFLRTIMDRPYLAELIKVLIAYGPIFLLLPSKVNSQGRIRVRQILSSKQLRTLSDHLISITNPDRGFMDTYDIVDVMLAFIVSKAVNVNYLTLSRNFMNFYTPETVGRLIELPVGTRLAFQKLQKVHLGIRHTTAPTNRPMLELMNPLFSLPNFAYLTLSGHAIYWTDYFSHIHSRTSSSLTELVLAYGSSISPETVCQVLQFTSNLKKLTYDTYRDELKGKMLQLNQALLLVRKTLESFKLMASACSFSEGVVSGSGPSLSSMEMLMHVELPLFIALGRHELSTATLEHTLPASLRSLTLGRGGMSGPDNNPAHPFKQTYYIDEILRFLENKDTSALSLECRTLKLCPCQEFKHCPRESPLSIPDRSTLELLHKTASEQGVVFQIEITGYGVPADWKEIIPNDMPYLMIKSSIGDPNDPYY